MIALHVLQEKSSITDWVDYQKLSDHNDREARTIARAVELGVDGVVVSPFALAHGSLSTPLPRNAFNTPLNTTAGSKQLIPSYFTNSYDDGCLVGCAVGCPVGCL